MPGSTASALEAGLHLTFHNTYAKLNRFEVQWRDKRSLLESHGYILRSRLQPGWQPSWMTRERWLAADWPTIRDIEDHADSVTLSHRVVDATRQSDGRLVCIKKVSRQVLEIMLHFSQVSLKDDSANHCVPVLDWFADDTDEGVVYVVMPFLRTVDDDFFDKHAQSYGTVGDVVHLVDQILEGVCFMHEAGVAHRALHTGAHILMDATPLYRQEPYPWKDDRRRHDFREETPCAKCIAPRPVKYYFVHFEDAVYKRPGKDPMIVATHEGLNIPEASLRTPRPHDPFKAEIYSVAYLLRRFFYTRYSNIEFLAPILGSMLAKNPMDRPEAATVLARWREIRKDISVFKRACPLRDRGMERAECVFLTILWIVLMITHVFKRYMPHLW